MTHLSRSVAVVGAGLGGLSAAIHLRLAGFEVTVYERGDAVGGRAGQLVRDGFTFDTGPTLVNYPWIFEDLFAAAGQRLAEHVELLPVDPTVRFAWPGGDELTLTSHLPSLAREFERLEPGSLTGLTGFLADCEAKYALAMQKVVTRTARSMAGWLAGVGVGGLARTSIWRSMHRELGRFFRSPRIVDALGSYAMYLGGSPRQLPGIFTILPYGELAYGLWMPRGGVYALVRAIERLALDIGVNIVTGADVRTICTSEAAVRGLEFADGSRVDARVVVSNVDVPTTWARLLRPARLARPPAMTPGAFTCYIGLRGLPEGLSHHTIFMPADSRRCYRRLLRDRAVPDDLAFYACAATATDTALAPPGHSTLFLLAPVPTVGDGLEPAPDEWKDDLRQRMVSRMASHGVRIADEDIVLEERWGPADWGSRYGLYRGSAFGAAHTLRQLGPMRSPNKDRSIKGLYYVGASTTPGTGMPMVVLGGRMTAEAVIADAR